MTLGWLIALVVLVVVVAFVLGRYFARREAVQPYTIKAKPPKAVGAPPNSSERLVTEWILSQAFEQTGIRVADDAMAYQRVAEAARKAVSELKTQPETQIQLPFLTADATGPKHVELTLTRAVLDELVRY
jgi:hypothetical protein